MLEREKKGNVSETEIYVQKLNFKRKGSINIITLFVTNQTIRQRKNTELGKANPANGNCYIVIITVHICNHNFIMIL